MPGLSAKVFRTFNASFTFQDQLRKLTPKHGSVVDKFAAADHHKVDLIKRALEVPRPKGGAREAAT